MTSSTARYAYLDWARGVAVLIMIAAHVFDSWVADPERKSQLFGYAMILGGMGAPLFLFLAGIAIVLSAESKTRKTGDFAAAWRMAERRGWQIFGLAFLFRIQSYILSGGFSAASLLKVDILNVMGPSMAAVAVTGRFTRARGIRLTLFVTGAVLFAMLTPVVRTTGLLNWLPDPIEWYFRPSPGRTNFTLFPWAGFVFAGAVVGEVIDAFRDAKRPSLIQAATLATGALVALAGYEFSWLPTIYERSEFWTSSPTYFFLRVGLLVSLLPLAYGWELVRARYKLLKWSPLEEMGKASLFIYWIHVEMVYGFFSRPLRRSLTLQEAMWAYILFTLFLLGLARLKTRLAEPRQTLYLTDNKSVI